MVLKNWKLVSILITFCISHSIGSDDGVDESLVKLAEANNNLGVKLYKELIKDKSGNIFFSPFSISNAFGMLFAGAEGNSAKQLRSVLGYDAANLSSSQVPTAFNQYLNKVLSNNPSEDPDYELNLANELLLSKYFKENPNYTDEVQNLFHANIKKVDFERNTEQILNEVNNFVSEQTHGKIKKLLDKLDPSTVLLILNAIYFHGNWKHAFNKDSTKKLKFYNHGSDSEATEVPFMQQTDKFPYTTSFFPFDTIDMQALQLPYKGDNISMIVLLPNQRDGLASLEKSITPEKILNILKRMYNRKVDVKLPKFNIEYKSKLKDDFKALGAKDIFRSDLADLSGIAENHNKSIYVSNVIHKAAIEVNEEGSVAAAATAIVGAPIRILPAPPPPPPPKFIADHPFMFAIVDNRNDLILFLGRITEF